MKTTSLVAVLSAAIISLIVLPFTKSYSSGGSDSANCGTSPTSVNVNCGSGTTGVTVDCEVIYTLKASNGKGDYAGGVPCNVYTVPTTCGVAPGTTATCNGDLSIEPAPGE